MKTPLSGHFMIWMKNTQLMGHKHLWTAFFRYTVTYYWPISTPLPTIGELVLLVSEQSYISYTSNPPLILTYKQVALMWKGSLQVSFMTHGLHTSGLRYVMTLYVCCVNQQLWILAQTFWSLFYWQRMRDSFSSATLLTSRSFNHGIESARDGKTNGLSDPACQANINYYLHTGKINITDGETCKVRCFLPHWSKFWQPQMNVIRIVLHFSLYFLLAESNSRKNLQHRPDHWWWTVWRRWLRRRRWRRRGWRRGGGGGRRRRI